MQRVKFEEKELTKVGENGTAPIFDTPITPAENFLAVFAGKNPLWMPMTTDTRNFTPRIDIDNVARGFVFDGEEKIAPENFGGPDMFGTEWVFVPVAGGSMVKPAPPVWRTPMTGRTLSPCRTPASGTGKNPPRPTRSTSAVAC